MIDNEQKLTNMDRLFMLDAYPPVEESQNIFMEALRDEIIFHYNNNRMYREFCVRKGFSPYRNFLLEEIPPVAVSVFKNLGEELLSVPRDEVRLKLQSSATSGMPSTIIVDKVTSKRQSKAMVKVLQSFLGKHKKTFLIMDIDPRESYGKMLGARFAAVSGYLKFSNKAGYFLKTDEKGVSYFDVDSMINFLKMNGNDPVVLFGFTYILYANVIKEIGYKKISVKLPEGSKIIHIGGWKKLESEKVDKRIFNRQLSECFGVSPRDVIDIYGFTEQMGLNYPDCGDGWKRTPAFSRVIARDPVTHEVVAYGKEGVLEFVSPVPHSYPGNAVLTDDIGVVMEEAESDGLYGMRFKVTGRMKKAEVRGCGDILSQKLIFQDSGISRGVDSGEKNLNVISFTGKLEAKDACGRMKEILAYLGKQQEWLEKQPVEALVGLIASVAARWVEDPKLQYLKDKGLVFLSSWLDKKNLRTILEMGLHGNLGYLDGFHSFPKSDKHYLKANPRGIVCHWLAGNVQILGMFALVQAILTKNVNLLRVSSKDDGVFKTLLNTFVGTEYTMENGYIIHGSDLLKTIALISYSHDNVDLGYCMSSQADVRIAWGGKESIQTVAAYPSRIGAETVIFGPKLSFAAIAKEELSTQKAAKSLARKLAVDISVFDQTGCASPHNLFLEKGGIITAEEFVELLAAEMQKTVWRIPKPKVSVEQMSQIHSIRGVYDFKGKVIGSDDLSWTLLMDEGEQNVEICPPVYSRVLFIHVVDSIFDCLEKVTDDIQTIGLAAPTEKGIRFAELATRKGVARLPLIGRMLNFEMPWDGVFLVDRLVKWNTLGGPLR